LEVAWDVINAMQIRAVAILARISQKKKQKAKELNRKPKRNNKQWFQKEGPGPLFLIENKR
jgi:hypothetical protein